ncbi:50S ribosomal protein L25 [Glutamicibacter sp. MNS18]|uniref:50S ribosomal protein L25 n=1 Tax=Glutamicibacter sp. MNS18 TaxID=2989817 RepID=UPI002235813E|nr:50S ribosomal protein L25 [Glutamicibacter sp. MNS18]MCW4465125.1 50S ribosomal protein L25 [Glutamicibacter sp. MNS18]
MSSINLDAVVRSDFGKGASRQARRNAQIPAVVYGAGSEPLHVLLPFHETTLAARDRSVVLVLNVDGKEIKTTIKELQVNALSRNIDHIDLMVAA